MTDIGRELQEIRESQIRTEESIKSLNDTTALKLSMMEQNVKSAVEALDLRIKAIETERKFYKRTIMSEVVKYAVGIVILLIGIKSMIP